MIGLVFASLVTWTIFLAKTIQLSRARRQLNRGAGADRRHPLAERSAIGVGLDDQRAVHVAGGGDPGNAAVGRQRGESSIKERAASRFTEIVRMEARAVRYGMAAIATIGATAPFVGLFGTVWGIMNSFIGISKAQTTNLAVVAPGIAEALLATAVGLAAAIPAVIIYNHFSRATKSYLDLSVAAPARSGGYCRAISTAIHGRMISRAAE